MTVRLFNRNGFVVVSDKGGLEIMRPKEVLSVTIGDDLIYLREKDFFSPDAIAVWKTGTLKQEDGTTDFFDTAPASAAAEVTAIENWLADVKIDARELGFLKEAVNDLPPPVIPVFTEDEITYNAPASPVANTEYDLITIDAASVTEDRQYLLTITFEAGNLSALLIYFDNLEYGFVLNPEHVPIDSDIVLRLDYSKSDDKFDIKMMESAVPHSVLESKFIDKLIGKPGQNVIHGMNNAALQSIKTIVVERIS
ncbi:hypothetical protein [Vibrio phage BONAISHI]|nr:hypothetical protein [Vibrio phage BONAISHI]